MNRDTLTTAAGAPVTDNQNSQSGAISTRLCM
jgi:hypothetical protein